jgi:hypothetical protein
MKTMLATGTALAAIAAAAPASAQSYYGYSQPTYSYARPTYNYAQRNTYAQPYGYAQSYQQPYGYAQSYQQPYGYAMNTSAATQQCTAAVQNRLYNRTSIGGILGAVLGTNTGQGRVLSITQVSPSRNGMVRVRGLASSGRYASNNYGPYGVGAYGALGYGYQNAADLSFRCDVDYRGYVRNVDINRR